MTQIGTKGNLVEVLSKFGPRIPNYVIYDLLASVAIGPKV